MSSSSLLSYSTRATLHKNPVARLFLETAEAKKSNLVISADFTTTAELLHCAEQLGPYISVFKTHIDLISDLTPTTITTLKQLATKHNFLIFEDRKFIDIGHTVQRQYHGGALRISEFAHVANISILSGDDVVSALAQVVSAHEFPYKGQRAFLLLAEMTSRGSLARGQYTRRCVELAREHGDVVIGFVATTALGSGSERQEREAESKAEAEGGGQEDFLVFSTGINQSSKGDALGQQYQTPTKAVEGGTDFIIVGRGIYAADDPVAAAKSYQREGWEAYLKRVGEL